MHIQVQVRIHLAWWVRWYLAGVLMTSSLTGLVPDRHKVMGWVSRGLRLEVTEARSARGTAGHRAGWPIG